MTFDQALSLMKEGRKVRRKNWSFSKQAYLELLDYNSTRFIYLKNKYIGDSTLEGYGLQFPDLEANDWEEVLDT